MARFIDHTRPRLTLGDHSKENVTVSIKDAMVTRVKT